MASIKPFNCYCVPDGPTYSGGGGGDGTGSGGGSGSGNSNTNPTSCNKCASSVIAATYKITITGVTGDCAANYNGTFNVGYHTANNHIFYSHHGNFTNTGGTGERIIMRNTTLTPKCCEFPYDNSPTVSRFILSLCNLLPFGTLEIKIGFTLNTTLCSAGSQTSIIYTNNDAEPINCLSPMTFTRSGAAIASGHTWPDTITIEPA